MSNYQARQLNMHTLIDVGLRHKKTIVVVPLVFLALGAMFFVFCPRTYRSEARLFLRVGRETVGIDPTATTGQTLPIITADRMDEVVSAKEIFKSRSVASRVVDQLGADVVLGRVAGEKPKITLASVVVSPLTAVVRLIKSVDPVSEREEAIIAIERNTYVSAERQATVVAVQYDAGSPQQAQRVCQAIVDMAQQEYIRVHRSDESRPFFTEQQERLRAQLDTSLEALRDAKSEMKLANVDQRRATLEAQYKAIELDRLSSQQQLATSQARIGDLERQLAEIPERMITSKRSIPNHGADLLRDRFYALQVEAMDLESRYRDAHPFVRAATDQLREAQKVIGEQSAQRTETTDSINSIHRELTLSMKQERSIVAGLRSRLAELDEQKQVVLADLCTVNEYEVKIDQLTRETELARAKYMQYARTLEEARIDKELQKEGVSNISVAQSATLAEKPVVPRRGLTVVGTLVLATASTVGLVLLGERPNWTGVPVTGSETRERRRPRRRIHRDLLSKTNGDAAAGETPSSPK
jgi:uncharacterized protein involved in exopolysaccharide biosynthesis